MPLGPPDSGSPEYRIRVLSSILHLIAYRIRVDAISNKVDRDFSLRHTCLLHSLTKDTHGQVGRVGQDGYLVLHTVVPIHPQHTLEWYLVLHIVVPIRPQGYKGRSRAGERRDGPQGLMAWILALPCWCTAPAQSEHSVPFPPHAPQRSTARPRITLRTLESLIYVTAMNR